MKNLHQWRQKSLILEELQAKSNSKSVVRQNREALGDIGNLVNVPTRKDTARKAEVVVIINPEENEKSCKPHVSKRGGFTVSLYYQAASGGLKDVLSNETDALDAGNKLYVVK